MNKYHLSATGQIIKTDNPEDEAAVKTLIVKQSGAKLLWMFITLIALGWLAIYLIPA